MGELIVVEGRIDCTRSKLSAEEPVLIERKNVLRWSAGV